ncbi:sulfotransferase [Nitrosomonas sp. JL21]|uniref:sulfotransferase family protein n=1 Tax=Nitrosomonas sp. JL21 TaxID=153949 RepID=UPI00136F056B|nr:sulfotransferase [Nitrosomonas sp. JL21]MBL8496340.1 sulfotransferase [Nitrosomonas sp.]MXS79081.1 sulfotransferase [Nitrosomonas sp. JL21]
MKVDFLGIGAQKCASTWVHRVLSDHPDVIVMPGKEIDFFSYYYNFGYEWYERHIGKVDSLKKVGEVSPSYFADINIPERVYLYNPNMRIVLSLRDPIERAYSNHLHEVRLGHVTGENLEFEKGLINNPMYLIQSQYSQQLAQWLKVFPRDQVLVIFQEDIRDNPIIQAQKLYHFLDISEDHRSWFLEKKVNESFVIKNTKVDYFLKQLGKLGRSVGAGELIETVKKNDLVRHIRRQHNQIDLRQIIPPLSSDTRTRLLEILADDMNVLSQQLGRENLPWPSWRALKNRVTAE